MDDRPAGDRSVPDREQLERAIAAQESLRGVVPDDVVDAAIATLRLQLDSAQVESQRRRQVTVLFADVSGFTSMSSGLDPETVAGVINDAWARLDSVIVGHGGHIDKHIGDGVMAIWGMPSTREDDPERAVRAALAMQHELEAANSNGLRMRVGINTGPVHVGAVGAAVSTEFTAIGDAVNVASRVEGVAPLGGVLVTHDTYRHIRGVFDVDELPPAVVKGRVEPVRVYLVRRAKDRAFRMPTRGVEGVETHMIGRARELSVLQAEFDRVLRAPGMRLVIFTGEAGVGKSRLLYEFEHWIDLHPASAYFFKGRALATRQSIPFGLARDLFGDRFDVLDSDSAAVVAEKLGAGFGPTLTAGEAEVVGHWLGFDLRASAAVQALLGAGKLPPTARAHLVHYLNTLASDSPVVVFLEDLHWADDESLALVDELIVELESARILAVGVARPTVRERLAAEPLFDRAETVFDLGALDADSTRTLVTEVLQRAPAVPDELADLVVARADGNAFYVEELVKMLIEDGVIETGEPWDPWAIHVDRLDPDRVPATLTGVLQTRLDILAPPERAALQRSSVVGRVFWDGTVASLGSDSIEATARSLELTRQRELVFRHDQSSFAGTVEYRFKHALLRDVAYETVLLRDRQQLHALAARWITEHAGERLVEYAGLIATHYRLADEAGVAADLLHKAAGAALEAGNASGARRSLDEAFALWRQIDRDPPADAMAAMAEACLRLGDIEDGRRHAAEARKRATAPEDRLLAGFVASWAAGERGDYASERELLDDVLPEAEQVGGVLLERVLCGLSGCMVRQGETGAALAYAQRAKVLADARGQPAGVIRALGTLGWVAESRGDIRSAIQFAGAAVHVALDAGDLDGAAGAYGNLGVGHHLLGDNTGSRRSTSSHSSTTSRPRT